MGWWVDLDMAGTKIIERRLAAIMFTDIAGYTVHMSKDEAAAISLLNKKESVLKPLIAEHNGKYVKSTGDGTLSHFNSAVDAVSCAKRFQESIYNDKNLNIRIGVHLGDTIFEKGDIRGNGVNVASRLESIAVEGGVFISKEVHDQLVNQKEFEAVSLGLQSMRGVGRLIEVFGLKGDMLNEPNPNDYQVNKVAVHSDDEVPSIAIIPFDNKGSDEDVFYAYGISADLISDCSGAGLIRVASLKQIEELEDLTVEEKAKKLDVRYISTGTLWKMGNMFQLSIELYDTKESKVLWLDRWQESWDNLTAIKGNLSDGLLKALDTKPKVEKKADTSNPEAYEYYLKAKYKYEKRKNMEDTEIARGLLQKAISLDDNLITAKIQLGWTYVEVGDYDKAMFIYEKALKKSEELGDKSGVGLSLNDIGNVYYNKGDYDKALDFYSRSFEIFEEIADKNGTGESLGSLGIVYSKKGDYDKALDYQTRSLEISEELDYKLGMGMSFYNLGSLYTNIGGYDKALDNCTRSHEIFEEISFKRGMGYSLNNIGINYFYKGDYDKALEHYTCSLEICEEISDKRGIGESLHNIGSIYHNKGDYDKVIKYFEKSLAIQKEIGYKGIELLTTTYLYLTYKNLGKAYNKQEINTLIKETENIEFEINYRLYELLADTNYLENAFNQIQDIVDKLEPEIITNFLEFPIPKAIIQEWQSES